MLYSMSKLQFPLHWFTFFPIFSINQAPSSAEADDQPLPRASKHLMYQIKKMKVKEEERRKKRVERIEMFRRPTDKAKVSVLFFLLQSFFSMGFLLATRVHKNKSMQHHTLGSGTAEFQVTWPPKLREGTYLVKKIRARFEYRKTIAAHEKQVIMQEKAQPCASLWRKTLRPKRVRFFAIDARIVDYVCLPLYHLTFLGSYQPLCEFREEKRKKKRDKRVQVSSINSWHESAVYRAALPHRYTILYNTQKSRYLKFCRARAPYWRDQALHTLVPMHSCLQVSPICGSQMFGSQGK